MSQADFRAQARIETAQASKYLQQLCKHFLHKLPASFDATAGQIGFPAGETRLTADAQELAISLAAASDDDLVPLQELLVRRFNRFASAKGPLSTGDKPTDALDLRAPRRYNATPCPSPSPRSSFSSA